MKFASVAILLSALAAASPIYQIEWVTLTSYTTILADYDDYTAAFPQTSTAVQTPTTAETVATQTSSSSTSQATTQTFSEVTFATTSTTPVPTVPTTTSTTPVTTSTTPATTSTTPATTSSTQTSSTGTGSVFSGDGTYYDTGLGACGWTNVDTDYIAAIGHGLFDQYTPNGNPNHNTLCGKKIIAHYGGKSVEVTAVDRCEGCKPYDLDFSPAAFEQIADQLLGRIKITWQWA